MFRWLAGPLARGWRSPLALGAEPVGVNIGYLHHAGIKEPLSLIAQPAENDGVAGARLAIEDNNTTGKFLNQHFNLDEVRLKGSDDVVKAAQHLAGHDGFIIADL